MNTPTDTEESETIATAGAKSHSDQRMVSQRRETCQWTEDENGPHETECGHAFEFTYDGVEANGFKYCCFCGGSIVLKLANAGTQRPGTPDGSLATETRKPGSLK